MSVEQSCPECGRRSAAQLCPNCGYPLMFDARQQQPTPVAKEFLRKPVAERGAEPDRGGRVYQSAEPVATREMLGPFCPGCRHRNPARRVRCELCATELWPGAAYPPRLGAAPPPTARPVSARPMWPWVIAAVVVGLVAVYAIAYFLA
jgi:predicted amidophosphoribosyltransferase